MTTAYSLLELRTMHAENKQCEQKKDFWSVVLDYPLQKIVQRDGDDCKHTGNSKKPSTVKTFAIDGDLQKPGRRGTWKVSQAI